jgi:hypothetical protein
MIPNAGGMSLEFRVLSFEFRIYHKNDLGSEI